MPRILVVEDGAEFRIMRAGSGDETLYPWLEEFLSPEAIGRQQYVAAAHQILSDYSVEQVGEASKEASEYVSDSDVLLVERVRVDSELLTRLPRVQTVAKFGSQTDNIDREALDEHGIQLVTASRVTSQQVADHTLLLMLALVRSLPASLEVAASRRATPSQTTPASVEEGGHPATVFNWAGLTGIKALTGMNLGILGLGEIGHQVAERARSFGMNIGYWSRQSKGQSETALSLVRFENMEELASWADVVSIHLAYAPSLNNIVDTRFLDCLGRDGYLINTSRPLLLDLEAVDRATRDQRLAGVALDVLPEEPPSSHPLPGGSRVLVTPHVAGGTRWSLLEDIREVIVSLQQVTQAATDNRAGR